MQPQEPKNLKIMHTSDWHIGRQLYGRKRYAEFHLFLEWIIDEINKNQVDVLIIAGDIFDTTVPSNRSQELYYNFLSNVAFSYCRHIVITAGNHDSASFLDAPKGILKGLNIHVVGAAKDPSDEVILLRTKQGEPELIVCAVPYLKERELRLMEAGEAQEDKASKLTEGIRQHYALAAKKAEEIQSEAGHKIPIIATGHLFTAGGKITDGDGIRDLYIGSLVHVPASIFPASFDYLALGHLHTSQKVSGQENIRYSGSPLQLSFGESTQKKSICLVEFDKTKPSTTQISVPIFQKIVQVRGDLDHIQNSLSRLVKEKTSIWVEIFYEGDLIPANLKASIEEVVAGSSVEVLRTRNNRIINRALAQEGSLETLEDLETDDVFLRLLEAHKVLPEQHPSLIATYHEAIDRLDDNKL